MEITIDTNGNTKQKQCAIAWGTNNDIYDILYGGSKGSGKSYIGCSLIFSDALTYPGTHYFIARKELNDLRKFTIPSIYEVFDHFGVGQEYYKYNGQDNYFELYNGSKVFLLAAKYLPSDPKYKRFGSMQMTRGWIEEAGEFHSDADTNLSITVGRWKNDIYKLAPKVLRTCNPSKNYLYKDYYLKNKRKELDSHKLFIQALPTDNKMLTDGYIEQLHRTLSKNEKERLLYGNWEYDDDPMALCEYNAINDIFSNDHVTTGEKYITADIARFGSDKAVILVWAGWVVVQRLEYKVSSTVKLQKVIDYLRKRYRIPKSNCIADEDGVGGGVVDNCGIVGFVNNSKALVTYDEDNNPKKENYVNLKTQCQYYLAKKINSGGLWYKANLEDSQRESIIEELEQLKRLDKDDKLRIVSKDKMKEKLGRSPDDLDALGFRSYFDYRQEKTYDDYGDVVSI